jgi:heme exporter protein B
MATLTARRSWFGSCRLVFEYSVRSVFIRKASWAGTLAFAACLAILFPFAFGTELIQKAEIRHGAFWAINEFVVALTVGRLFALEAESGILEMMLASGMSRSALLFGKILFVVLYLLSVQVPLLVLWIVFYNVPNAALFSLYPILLPLLLLFNLGTGTVGALLSCVTARSTGRDLLMPLLFYPLQLSVLLAAVSLATYTDPGVVMLAGTQGSSWWTILAGVPVLFLAVGVLLSQALFQE